MALRELGHAGAITLLGAERHAPYERPPMSKELMLTDGAMLPKTIATHDRLAEVGVTFQPSTTVLAIDRACRTVALSDGTVLPYDRLLLATGARPRRLPVPGAGDEHCVTLRTHDDALHIRDRLIPGSSVAIVGGGFIGLELAAAARRRGAEVTVIEALPRLLSRGVPAEIAARIEARHRTEGVAFVFGRGIAAIEAGGVLLADGTRMAADLVVIGIGAIPETALAETAGLVLDNGIAVDEQLRTSDPLIFAAGDCCSFPLPLYGGRRVRLESWRSAQDLGALAARNLLGAGEAIAAVPWFWSDQYELTLQIAGLPDEGESIVRRETGDSLLLFHLKSDGKLVAASGIGPGNAVARDIRLAEMLIGRRAAPEVAALADPAVKLKALLAA
jgi:3-phenylpropionate/trans-cinnamate dioxygenase ferredoxin reductase subunit